jgi:predicted nucleic acid-binding protein
VLYLDTSSLLKTFFPEPESDAVDAALAIETRVVITSLTELEISVQLQARHLGGSLTTAKYRRTRERLEWLRETEPFVFRPLAGAVFATAVRQHGEAGKVHCRSLDRLHLAAMEELSITRLMTHDSRQADVARTMGFDVVVPA